MQRQHPLLHTSLPAQLQLGLVRIQAAMRVLVFESNYRFGKQEQYLPISSIRSWYPVLLS